MSSKMERVYTVTISGLTIYDYHLTRRFWLCMLTISSFATVQVMKFYVLVVTSFPKSFQDTDVSISISVSVCLSLSLCLCLSLSLSHSLTLSLSLSLFLSIPSPEEIYEGLWYDACISDKVWYRTSLGNIQVCTRIHFISSFAVQVTGGRGNNLHEVVDAENKTFLVSMPNKFRKNIWVKRGK